MSNKTFGFDIHQDAIQALAKILKDADLTEIEYEDQDHRVRLTRSHSVTTVSASTATTLNASQAVAASVTPVSSSNVETIPAKQHPGALKSPMVGTLYLSPEPGSAPFAKVGSKVNAGDTVFIIEAMKVMNPIKAQATGIVKEIFFKDGSPIEFGDILMIIE